MITKRIQQRVLCYAQLIHESGRRICEIPCDLLGSREWYCQSDVFEKRHEGTLHNLKKRLVLFSGLISIRKIEH